MAAQRRANAEAKEPAWAGRCRRRAAAEDRRRRAGLDTDGRLKSGARAEADGRAELLASGRRMPSEEQMGRWRRAAERAGKTRLRTWSRSEPIASWHRADARRGAARRLVAVARARARRARARARSAVRPQLRRGPRPAEQGRARQHAAVKMMRNSASPTRQVLKLFEKARARHHISARAPPAAFPRFGACAAAAAAARPTSTSSSSKMPITDAPPSREASTRARRPGTAATARSRTPSSSRRCTTTAR